MYAGLLIPWEQTMKNQTIKVKRCFSGFPRGLFTKSPLGRGLGRSPMNTAQALSESPMAIFSVLTAPKARTAKVGGEAGARCLRLKRVYRSGRDILRERISKRATQKTPSRRTDRGAFEQSGLCSDVAPGRGVEPLFSP